MKFNRTATFCLAALFFYNICVSKRSIEKRQALHEREQELLQQEEIDFQLKFAILSRSSGKYLTMLENGSVFASGVPVRGQLAPSSHWYLHMSGGVHRLENVHRRDHYLAVAHRDNVTILVTHDISKLFTPEMSDPQKNNSDIGGTQNTTQHNETTFITTSTSTFSVLIEWNIHSVDTLTNNMMLVRNGTDCYLSFDHEGYPHNNLCSLLGIGENIDFAFQPVF